MRVSSKPEHYYLGSTLRHHFRKLPKVYRVPGASMLGVRFLSHLGRVRGVLAVDVCLC